MRRSTDLDHLSAIAEIAPFGVGPWSDVIVDDNRSCARLDDVPYAAARAPRESERRGGTIVAAIGAIRAIARRALEQYRRYRDASETYEALRSLDDRTLRDLGIDRSEMSSVATELAADALQLDFARVRIRSILSR